MIKSFVRKWIPEPAVSAYHYALAVVAALAYGQPSEKLVVIGVTGTNGKSTTTEYIGRILENAGHRVGWTGTTSFKVAECEWTNAKKMTMLGRFETQRMLAEMVKAKCAYAIVETSSQGIAQSRHVGIDYDVAVFTNLTPEHIESHGGFENYKRAKGKLFAALSTGRRKGGQKTPYWNQRTISSLKEGSRTSPFMKPPMSVVHQGMPLMAMFSPAGICLASTSKRELMSPDQTAAP